MGGHDALQGFLRQALIALIRACSVRNWGSFTVEPELAEEIVDVYWELDGGRRRITQVKGQSATFKPGQVREWAKSLSKAAADERELVLIGHGSAAARKIRVAGVSIGFAGPALDASLFGELSRYYLSIGANASVGEVDVALEPLVAQVFIGSAKPKTWTPESLKAAALGALLSGRPTHVPATEFVGKIDRTIIIDRFQVAHDVCVYCVVNCTNTRSGPAQMVIQWTDCSGDALEHVAPPGAMLTESDEVQVLRAAFPVPELEAGENWSCAAVARRPSLVARDGDRWTYTDPIRAHEGSWSMRVTIISVSSAQWLSMPAEFIALDHQVARFEGKAPLSHWPVIFQWRAAPARTPTTLALEHAEAAARLAGHATLHRVWICE